MFRIKWNHFMVTFLKRTLQTLPYLSSFPILEREAYVQVAIPKAKAIARGPKEWESSIPEGILPDVVFQLHDAIISCPHFLARRLVTPWSDIAFFW